MLVNIFGYMGGPLVTGWAMEYMGPRRGMQAVYLASGFSLVFLVGGLIALRAKEAAKKRTAKERAEDQDKGWRRTCSSAVGRASKGGCMNDGHQL